MKFNFQLLLLLLLSTLFAEAQKLELANVGIKPLMWVDMEAADFDLDGDMDLFIIGQEGPQKSFSGLYINDGRGKFSLSSITFLNLYQGSIAVNDLNGDLYPDIYITGWDENEKYQTALYFSDGQGSFTADAEFDLPAIKSSSSELKDVDQDGQIDLIISGSLNSTESITRIYFGKENGKFDRTNFQELEWLRSGDLKVEDLDSDGDLDILYTGVNDDITKTILYSNEGDRVFQQYNNHQLIGLNTGSISIADVNRDGLPDIYISGYSPELLIPQSRIYINKGDLSFENLDAELDNVVVNTSGFGDFNNDDYPDLFLTGYNQEKENVVAKIYLNDKGGKFSESTFSELQGLQTSSSAIEDFNGDGFDDILYAGLSMRSGNKFIALYSGEGCFEDKTTDQIASCGPYTWINGITYYESNTTDSLTLKNRFGCDSTVYLNLTIGEPKIHRQTVTTRKPYKHSDYTVYLESQIGLLDTVALASGCDSITITDVEIIRPISAAGFTRDTVNEIKKFKYGQYSFSDLNRDGLLDIFLNRSHESNSSEEITFISNEDRYSEENGNLFNIPNYRISSIIHADLDNDGDDDFLVWGYDTTSYSVYQVQKLIQIDTGKFSVEAVPNIPFSIINGSRHLEDLDMDGYPDLIIFDRKIDVSYQDSTFNESDSSYQYQNPVFTYNPKNQIFLNDGNGNFKAVENNGLDVPVIQSVSFGDIDDDNYKDLIFISVDSDSQLGNVLVYKQNSPGKFSELFELNENVKNLRVSGFVNINNDDIKDFIIQGTLDNNFYSKVFYGQSDHTFSEQDNFDFRLSSVNMGDFDSDGDTDFILYGFNSWPYLHLNDGKGNFVKTKDSPFLNSSPFNNQYSQIIDLNQDGYLDYIDRGIIYWNDGCQIDYYEDRQITYTPFEWIDGKTYSISTNVPRIVLKNQAGCDSVITLNLEYRNTPRGEGFVEITPENLQQRAVSSIAIADINGDGLNDLGTAVLDISIDSKIYLNTGNRKFSNLNKTDWTDYIDRQIFFKDLDLDGDQDIILDASIEGINFFLNDGAGSFAKNGPPIIKEVEVKTISLEDIDNDGYPDIAVSGYNNSLNLYEAKIFFNDGLGGFQNPHNAYFEKLSYGTIDLVDLDGDADKDIIVTGITENDKYASSCYQNIGFREFIPFSCGLPGFADATIKFKDLDGDFDKDVVISGWLEDQRFSVTRLFENDGNGHFSTSNSLDDEYYFHSLDFSDIDGDDDQDFIAQEEDNQGNLFTTVYQNEGNLNFSRKPKKAIEGLRYGDIKVADMDGDKAPDIIISGMRKDETEIVRIFYNENAEDINYPDYAIDNIISDEPIVWIDGKTYNESTSRVQFVLTNSMGGDSIVTLNLLITEKVLAAEREQIEFNLYPNPTDQILNLKLGHQPNSEIEFQIISSNGVLRRHWKSNKQSQTIDISGLEAGSYILKVFAFDLERAFRFVKQ
ncbi:FG-GAP-like repeat-containing protein [Jiulongibacter sediminis]|uniref:Secretion system C-terminal sorting domain-containing protein n=1 Tax=Jiulongibacter sediminis TaxID=1605367 RepID=A0A0P7C4Y4_9BACT|nr:FG-GAP-like repeat-containing protein [Jiulongibacter sediminis]KPM47059.1 hypothetical protein AFM12_17715 [Jiulongibacter sediminis]TBX22403.1 hypothetical protein TK44_17720 [Jiulongibacter sediminis]